MENVEIKLVESALTSLRVLRALSDDNERLDVIIKSLVDFEFYLRDNFPEVKKGNK